MVRVKDRVLSYYSIKSFTGGSQDQFLCSNPPPNTPSNISVLQICDNVTDCADGADEHMSCSIQG